MNTHAVGKELEKAVYEIEHHILSHNPALKESNFTIEKNKFLTLKSVKNEIDLFLLQWSSSPTNLPSEIELLFKKIVQF